MGGGCEYSETTYRTIRGIWLERERERERVLSSFLRSSSEVLLSIYPQYILQSCLKCLRWFLAGTLRNVYVDKKNLSSATNQ